MRRKTFSVLVVLAMIGVFYLTLQSAEETTALTGKAIDWLLKFGITVQPKILRHDIHYVEYAVLGFFLYMSMRNARAIPVAALIGLLDEGIKVLLPTREFDFTDLLRDIVGAAAAIGILMLLESTRCSVGKDY